jgi:hypothetical protein
MERLRWIDLVVEILPERISPLWYGMIMTIRE